MSHHITHVSSHHSCLFLVLRHRVAGFMMNHFLSSQRLIFFTITIIHSQRPTISYFFLEPGSSIANLLFEYYSTWNIGTNPMISQYQSTRTLPRNATSYLVIPHCKMTTSYQSILLVTRNYQWISLLVLPHSWLPTSRDHCYQRPFGIGVVPLCDLAERSPEPNAADHPRETPWPRLVSQQE